MYKKDLALNNLQWLICHKTQPNQTKHALMYYGDVNKLVVYTEQSFPEFSTN